MSSPISIELFRKALPKHVRDGLTVEMVDNINKLVTTPGLMENYRDNLLSYTSVMADGKYKMQSYIDAVRYVSFKLRGDSNVTAYTKAFPDRYNYFINNGATDKDISASVAAYNKNKLVNLIFEQTIIPSHILNADMYQKALNVQADLMLNAVSEKVRTDAANSLLTHLKSPEVKKIEIDIGVKTDKSIDELRATTLELVAQQRAMITGNYSTAKQIAHAPLLIEGEVADVY